VPITEDGKMGGKLVGIVTNRDVDFVADRTRKLSTVMTSLLITAHDKLSLEECNQRLKDSKKAKLPIITEKGELVALMSRSYVIITHSLTHYTHIDFISSCYID
jgi:IMP dehydrogenase